MKDDDPTRKGTNTFGEHGGTASPIPGTLTPASLTTDAGLLAFIRRVLNDLVRILPNWMQGVAIDAAVDAALFVRANPDRFESIQLAYAYARRVAINKAIKEHRRARRFSTGWDKDAPAKTNFEPGLIAAQAIWWGIDQLPRQLQRTLIAIKIDEMEPAEFAKLDGVSLQTVYNRLHTARRLLRRLLVGDDSKKASNPS